MKIDLCATTTRNFSSLSHEAIMALGAYQRKREILEDFLTSGIEFCEELKKGYDLTKFGGRLKHGEVRPYDRYNILNNHQSELQRHLKNDITIEEIINKLTKIRIIFTDIKDHKNKGYSDSIVDEAREIFMAVGLVFWREGMKATYKRREMMGLRLHE